VFKDNTLAITIGLIIVAVTAIVLSILIYFQYSEDKLEDSKKDETPEGNRFHFYYEYHKQSLFQSRVGFYLSLGGGVIGLAVILIAVIIAVFSTKDATGLAVSSGLTTISGVIIEAISALLYSQTNQTRKLMTDSFDKLLNNMNVDQALETAREINDVPLKNKVYSLIAQQLAGVKNGNEPVTNPTPTVNTGASPPTEGQKAV
jgi:hypothetical protein